MQTPNQRKQRLQHNMAVERLRTFQGKTIISHTYGGQTIPKCPSHQEKYTNEIRKVHHCHTKSNHRTMNNTI